MDRKREAEPGASAGELRWAPVVNRVATEIPNVRVYDRWCKGCGICVEFCPKKVLQLSSHAKAEVVAPERCARCGLCDLLCPDYAVNGPTRVHK